MISNILPTFIHP